MTDQSVFEEQKENQSAEQPSAQTTSNPNDLFTDKLQAIRNEETGEPKYKTLETALDALKHSQEYIPELKSKVQKYEQELETLRTQLSERESVEEVVSRLTNKPKEEQAEGHTTQTAGLDEATVEQLVELKLQQQAQQSTYQNNLQKVDKALRDQYGDKAHEMVSHKATEFGMSLDQFKDYAAKSPDFVLAAFNSKSQSGVKPTTGSVNIEATPRQEDFELTKPEKSLLAGATSKEQAEYLRQVKQRIYAKHGVTS